MSHHWNYGRATRELEHRTNADEVASLPSSPDELTGAALSSFSLACAEHMKLTTRWTTLLQLQVTGLDADSARSSTLSHRPSLPLKSQL